MSKKEKYINFSCPFEQVFFIGLCTQFYQLKQTNMQKNYLFLFILTILLSSPGANSQATEDHGGIKLIESSASVKYFDDSSLYFFDQKDKILRFKEISLNPAITNKGHTLNQGELALNLFDDAEYTVSITRSVENVNKSVSLIAVNKEEKGYFVMSTTGSRSLGSFYLPNKNLFYKIISDPITNQHFLIEMKASDRDILEGGPSLIPETNKFDLQEQIRIDNYLKDQNLGPDDLANIDVMVLYTTNANDWANTTGGGIENIVANAMANAQLVLDNSGILMTMTLVHSRQINYVESGNSGDDLSAFTQNSNIHQLRDQYRADLTSVFTRVNDVGGVGWLLTSRHGRPNTGFCITRVQQAADSYTHIHEMGHNMGCHHHRLQNFQPGPTIWDDWPENLWSGGWRWIGDDGVPYCSVMTYTSGTYFSDGITHNEVPYFSSPSIIHEGTYAGDPLEGDNARTLNEIKHVIAAYRTSELATVFTQPVSDISFTEALSGGEITDDGGTQIVQRGVVWNTSPSPTLENNVGYTIDGTGTGSFISTLTDLTPGITYYLAAYATSETGTSYGVQRIFDTEYAIRATVSSNKPSFISHNTIKAGGRVSQGGNSPVTERGVVWSTKENPTIDDNEGFTIDGSGTGQFNSEITGLNPETTYFYRAYATNIGGTNYGFQQSITTLFARVYPNPFTDVIQVGFINESDNEVAIVLTDSRGQMVARIPVNHKGEVEELIPVAQLNAGVYFLTIVSEFEFPVWKLIKTGN